MKFVLGNRVKDRVTGVEGVATGCVDFLNGCTQYLVRPAVDKEKPGTYPDAVWIDDQQLDLVGTSGLEERDVRALRARPFALGNRVRCAVTGFEGIATSRAVYLGHSTIMWAVRPAADPTKPGAYPDSVHIEEEILTKVDDGITPAMLRDLAESGGPSDRLTPPPVARQKTGGPGSSRDLPPTAHSGPHR